MIVSVELLQSPVCVTITSIIIIIGKFIALFRCLNFHLAEHSCKCVITIVLDRMTGM